MQFSLARRKTSPPSKPSQEQSSITAALSQHSDGVKSENKETEKELVIGNTSMLQPSTEPNEGNNELQSIHAENLAKIRDMGDEQVRANPCTSLAAFSLETCGHYGGHLGKDMHLKLLMAILTQELLLYNTASLLEGKIMETMKEFVVFPSPTTKEQLTPCP